MLITIYLSDTDAHAESAVASFIERETFINPNISGADIRLERGDYTCVDGADALIGAQLLADVRHVINTITGRVD